VDQVTIEAAAILGCFWGDDGYGLERAADRLADRLATTSGLAPDRHRVAGAETSTGELLEWVATAPLFGGGTLVTVVETMPLLRSTDAKAALVGLLDAVAPGNGLVFIDAVDGSTGGRRPKALEELAAAVAERGGETAELRAPTEGRLAAWIEVRAKERDMRLAPGAAKELGTRLGGFVREGDVDRRRIGLLAVAELDKLALYRPAAEVTTDDVRALTPEAVPASSWAFLDSIGYRRIADASARLPGILDSLPEPVVVAQLHRRLRELIEVADHLESGAAPGSLVRTLGLKPYRAEKLVEQARRWSLPELEAALEGLAELDERIKGLTGSTDGQRRLAFTLWLSERVAPGGVGAAT
jgi:DNA polymerase-3 subunit delta